MTFLQTFVSSLVQSHLSCTYVMSFYVRTVIDETSRSEISKKSRYAWYSHMPSQLLMVKQIVQILRKRFQQFPKFKSITVCR